MANDILKQYWLGMPLVEIGARRMSEQMSAEQAKLNIEEAIKQIVDTALDGIIGKAKEGDVAAVEWLESRGLIKFPNCASGRTEADRQS